MSPNHILCLYVSYYLSRFNEEAYSNLGFGNMNETHEVVGRILETNPHTVKNMRDQFDPIHGHRAGWYQEPLSPSRQSIVEGLEQLTEPEIRSIIEDILSGKINKDEDQKEKLLSIISNDKQGQGNKKFILRGPTGKQAEELFIKDFQLNKMPIEGMLLDHRELGGGYDFIIDTSSQKYFIEVKGLYEYSGGVLFTNKEWETAKKEGDMYFLCLISNIKKEPIVTFIQNPFANLKPKKQISRVIQITWGVTQKQLAGLK